jgi:hypothetical protein
MSVHYPEAPESGKTSQTLTAADQGLLAHFHHDLGYGKSHPDFEDLQERATDLIAHTIANWPQFIQACGNYGVSKSPTTKSLFEHSGEAVMLWSQAGKPTMTLHNG